jgi:hypothetical protein
MLILIYVYIPVNDGILSSSKGVCSSGISVDITGTCSTVLYLIILLLMEGMSEKSIKKIS